jgi:hypothetical protein
MNLPRPAINRPERKHVSAGRFSLLLLGLAFAGPALADPGYYLLTPYSQPGQLALDLRYWSVKSPGQPATLWPELGVRYGVDSRWTTELLASYIGDSLSRLQISSLNWQNSYLLTQGQYPFDLAVHAQLIHVPGADGGNVLELGPLFQTDVGSTQVNLNLVFEHDWISNGDTGLKYQWQVMQRLRPGVRLGLQGFGELGPWDHWSGQQSHRAGPVLRLGLLDDLDVQAAYLWGTTYGSRGDMLSAQVLWTF